jgi:hypothetical protein
MPPKKEKNRETADQTMFTSKGTKRYSWSHEDRPLGQTKNTSSISGYIARVLSLVGKDLDFAYIYYII